MRISKLYMPAAAMAGALALAACGGGSDDMTNGGNPPGGGTPPAGTTTLDLPDGVTLDGGADRASGDRGNYTIEAGEEKQIQNAVFTCEETTADCVVTVSADRNASSVTVRGKVSVEKYAAPAVMVTGNNPPPSSTSTDPLSESTLVKALKGDRRVVADQTVWNQGNATWSANNLTGAGSASDVTLTTLAGETTKLWISASGQGGNNDDGTSNRTAADRSADDSYVYYGHWEKTSTETLSTASTPATRGTIFGGNMRYGQRPDVSLGEATYNQDNAVTFYYKKAAGKWTPGAALGDLDLKADFGNGMVGGNVTISSADFGTGHAADEKIYLRDTSIGRDGQFGGSNAKAEFILPDGSKKRQDGEWNGGFFGPTTVIVNNVQGHEEPSHVAGQFSIKREDPATGGGYTNDLTVHGAFGAAID